MTMSQKLKKSLPNQVASLKQTLQMPHRQFGLLPHWRRTFQGTQIILKPCKEHLANQKRSQTSKPKSISHNSPFVPTWHFVKKFHFELRGPVSLVKNNSAHDIKLNKLTFTIRKCWQRPPPSPPQKRYESPHFLTHWSPMAPILGFCPQLMLVTAASPLLPKHVARPGGTYLPFP